MPFWRPYIDQHVWRKDICTWISLPRTWSDLHMLFRKVFLLLDDATLNKTVHIDGLSPLTVTSKDAFGKTHEFLRFWIPNLKTWMFKYVLQAIPELIGTNVCLKVRAFISDGEIHAWLLWLIKPFLPIIMSMQYWYCVHWLHLVDRPMVAMQRWFHTKEHGGWSHKLFLRMALLIH